ncbi:MAG: gamma-glutamylcyclotransferase [Gammaproteobacteria bacterium]
MTSELWVFAYGSLLWKPVIPYVDSCQGRITGWARRFWQGSPDHRGTPEKPGRVVTLVPKRKRQVTGMVYRLSGTNHQPTLDYLDHRESGGYQRCWVTVSRPGLTSVRALTYVALPGNPHYVGPASRDQLRAHIHKSVGPSGANIEYYQELIRSLTLLDLTHGELLDLTLEKA